MDNHMTVFSALPIKDAHHCYTSRDTFIAFNGLFLIPRTHIPNIHSNPDSIGHYHLARTCLLQWANLYREGQMPSYVQELNSKFAVYDNYDCVWWFLKAVLDFVACDSDPITLLSRSIAKDQSPEALTFEEMVFDIFQTHKEGFSLLDREDCSVK